MRIYTSFVRSKSSGWHSFCRLHGSRSSWEEGHITMEASMQSWKVKIKKGPQVTFFFKSFLFLFLCLFLFLLLLYFYYLTVTVDTLFETGTDRRRNQTFGHSLLVTFLKRAGSRTHAMLQYQKLGERVILNSCSQS